MKSLLTVCKKFYSRIVSRLRKLYNAFVVWKNDPRHINRDWNSFKKMSDSELLSEFNNHFEQETAHTIRFRRLCHFIAIKWSLERRG